MLTVFWTFLISDAGQKLIQNFIALAALVLAVRGVRNWNRERRDLRRAELAERTLAIAYRAFDAFAFVRSPFGYEGEGSTRRKSDSETADVARALDIAFTPIERIGKITDVLEEIKTLRYSITAAFGLEVARPLLIF